MIDGPCLLQLLRPYILFKYVPGALTCRLILSFESVSASQVHVLLWTSFVSALGGGILSLSGNPLDLQAHELMDALKYNLRQEHIALSEFMANAHKILSPLQNATLFVNSWPFWPDLPNLVALAVDSTSL